MTDFAFNHQNNHQNNHPKIKLCGFTRQVDIDVACALGVDYVGFVFYQPSPRYISPQAVAALVVNFPPTTTTTPVGLFVNHSEDEVREAALISNIKVLQFHGAESPDFCDALSQSLGLPYWKALHVSPHSTSDSLLKLCQTYHGAQAVLFDTAIPTSSTADEPMWGGTGQTFEWQLLAQLSIESRLGNAPPLVLSGGLSVQNVAQGIQLLQPWAVDVSSGIEVIDAISAKPLKGVKDATTMAAFIQQVRCF